VTPDPIATPLAGALLDALLAAFDDPDNGVLPVCTAGLLSGSMLIADHCCADTTADGVPCEGQLTVRVEDVFPTEDFPEPRNGAIPVCGTSWAVRVEVATLRCALSIDSAAMPPVMPTMAEEMEVAERALADAGLLRTQLLAFAADRDQAVALGGYIPMGPDGGCVGGSMTATFLVE
jgi:hypothetical protein